MSPSLPFLLAPLALTLVTPLAAELPVPRLVKDIDQRIGDNSSDPTNFHEVDGKLLFSALAPYGDSRVWMSDGSAAGTQQVVNPVPDLVATWDPKTWVKAGGKRFFAAARADGGGMRLWTHSDDGTSSVTAELAAFPEPPQQLTACGDLLYFTVKHGATGLVLWRSDGTAPGTIPLTLADPGSAPAGSGFSYLTKLTAAGDELWFAANTLHLYRSRGTPETTVELDYMSKFRDGGIAEIVAADQGIFFTCKGGQNYQDILVKTTGTLESTISLGGANWDAPPDQWRDPENLHYWNGALYFTAWTPQKGGQLYRSDGTPGGTAMVKTIGGPRTVAPDILGTTDSFMFLEADDGKHGSELWRSDGTAKGTYLVKDITKGPGETYLGHSAVAGGKLWFSGPAGRAWAALWVSDGTAKGTRRLKSFTEYGSGLHAIGRAGGTCYFSANDVVHGYELWQSDGTPRGTTLLKDLADGGRDGVSDAANVAVLDGNYYFFGNNSKDWRDLWRSDGSSAGTVMVPEFSKGRRPPWLTDLSSVGGRLMVAIDNGWKVWSTDGTPTGLIKEQNFPGEPNPDRVAEAGGKSFAFIDKAIYLLRPGDRNGPLKLEQGLPNLFFRKGPIVAMKDRVYFPLLGDGRPPALWTSDGTLAGTVEVKQPGGAIASEAPRELTVFNGALYFLTSHDFKSRLWKSDGTAAGTTVLSESWDGDCRYFRLQACNGKLCLFGASSNAGMTRIFTTDGNSAPVLQTSFPTGDSSLTMLHSTGDEIYFPHFHYPPGGIAMWRTDGTAEGTFVLKDSVDPAPPTTPPVPPQPVTVGPWTYFAANDGMHGLELWRTDGSPANTVMIADLLDGPLGSWPQGLRRIGDRLLFTALTHGGRELWAIDDAGAAAAASAPLSTPLMAAAASAEENPEALLRHAFNVAQAGDTTPVIPGSGTAGYPAVSTTGQVLLVEYLRRKDGSLIYTPQYSPSLEPGSFQAMTGSITLTTIDAVWERVVAEQAYDPATTPRIFARVEVKAAK
ncbi:hypothetical protein [Haloferula sp. BvORR071]|uniref:hypothetical protein n=1 Tax=Haloferula sp. BvORR071 TaxID=1396141 RepID=UPI0005520D7D|nr:hypothetical protein [Haloferula sp. BvORR071]